MGFGMNRIPLFAAIIPMFANLNPCGSSAPSAPSASAPVAVAPTAARAPLAAKHGGTLIAAGNFQIEVLAKSDGTIRAYPAEVEAAAGADVTLPATANVVVTVPTSAGAPTQVPLTWTAGADAAFEGRVVGSAVRPGPCVVAIANAGPVPVQGQIAEMPVTPVAARGGTLVDIGDAKLEVVVAASGVVQAYPIYPTLASISTIPPEATVTVNVATTAGTPEPVELAWQGPIATFEGRGRGTFAAGPLSVRCRHGNVDVAASAPRYEVAPAEVVVVAGPQHGGQVIDIQSGHQVEVVVGTDGQVDAYPIATYVGAPRLTASAQVTVKVPVARGSTDVLLVWDPASAKFGGHCDGAAEGEVHVVLVDGSLRAQERRAVVIRPVRPVDRDAHAAAHVEVRGNAPAAPNPAASVGARIGAGVRAGARVEVRVPPPPSVRVNVGGSIRVGGH